MMGFWPFAFFSQGTWRLYGIVFAGLTLGPGCASSPTPIESGISSLSHQPRTDLPVRGISAHRGGLLGCPVNTIGAFQRAICQGVHQIELDVRATADGEIVVAHDDRVTDEQGRTTSISESTLAELQSLRLKPCAGEQEWHRIPTLKEALRDMPQNVWISVDIKDNNPLIGRLVAETVAKAGRLSQTIFGTRDETDLAVRRVAEEAGAESWVANMTRQIFRFQYVDSTISSSDEFIQLSFLRGRPGPKTMKRLKQAGVRVTYSWLREEDEHELKQDLRDLFDRGVDFVLVDHAAPAMKATCALGIPTVVPRWNETPLFTCPAPPSCAPAQ
ncbi:MAG: glycerophosphodiester phosphodiesterase [Nitrospirales bacterium]